LTCTLCARLFVPCSTQYKTVLDALRAKKERFTFEDVEISLKPSVMAFITMNPGYPGRAGGWCGSPWLQVCMGLLSVTTPEGNIQTFLNTYVGVTTQHELQRGHMEAAPLHPRVDVYLLL